MWRMAEFSLWLAQRRAVWLVRESRHYSRATAVAGAMDTVTLVPLHLDNLTCSKHLCNLAFINEIVCVRPERLDV